MSYYDNYRHSRGKKLVKSFNLDGKTTGVLLGESGKIRFQVHQNMGPDGGVWLTLEDVLGKRHFTFYPEEAVKLARVLQAHAIASTLGVASDQKD